MDIGMERSEVRHVFGGDKRRGLIPDCSRLSEMKARREELGGRAL